MLKTLGETDGFIVHVMNCLMILFFKKWDFILVNNQVTIEKESQQINCIPKMLSFAFLIWDLGRFINEIETGMSGNVTAKPILSQTDGFGLDPYLAFIALGLWEVIQLSLTFHL